MSLISRSLQADTGDIVANSGLFDADWYRRTYPDVATSGLRPDLHYARYGSRLGRKPSAGASDVAIADLAAALGHSRRISYCIPVMNRPDDIRGSLRLNLEGNSEYREQIEFVVIFFDSDFDTHDWVRSEFADELKSGYLRMIVSDAITWWHFGRAKNAFVKYMVGDIYSSLDGDNFVAPAETEQLLGLGEQFGDRFVFHQFSGNWGDGTSGRLSLPFRLYQSVGYDDHFLPRQFDEIDLIVSVLVRHPDTQFVRYEMKSTLFDSKRMQVFLEDRPRLPPPTYIAPPIDRRAPENPRGADYIEASEEFSAMLHFNQAVSFWRNSVPSRRGLFMSEVLTARRRVVDALPREKLLPLIVSPYEPGPEPVVGEDELCLFASVKNDDAFLGLFYEHYKRLGVNHFFLVDDGSDVPVRRVLPQHDVHVFKPEAGSFATAKGMWLAALMRRYLRPGMWALTIDADEFLDVLPGQRTFWDAIEAAEAAGQSAVPAILLDMVPGDTAMSETDSFAALMASFTHHAFHPLAIDEAYREHSSIAWGFGPYAKLSWAFDARYHAFGTYDSLRKLPLIRYSEKLHLNQGFHDIHFTDKRTSPGHAIWRYANILPMRHYKVLKLFEGEMFRQTQNYVGAGGSAYHERTAANISKIFGSGRDAAIGALDTLFRTRYDPASFQDLVKQLTGG